MSAIALVPPEVERETLPYSEDAEQAVLSACLMDRDAITCASKIVVSTMFYVEKNRHIFDAIVAMSEGGVTVEPLSLVGELADRGDLEAAGGRDYITWLTDVVPTSANVEYYAKKVAKYARQRATIEAYARGQRLAFDGKLDPQEIVRLTNADLEVIGANDDDDERVFVSIAELRKNPELLKPPVAVVPDLAWRGRASLLSGGDKLGKSTLSADAIASASKGGHFLGKRTAALSGVVLCVGLEEAIADAIQRADSMETVPENVELLTRSTPKLFEAIRRRLAASPCDLVLIDSLTEYARVVHGKAPEDGDSSGWSSVIRPLVALTREFPQTALLILHHARRSDGQFRSSGEIAAAVDCLLEMRPPTASEDPTLRHITGRARWPVPAFDVRFTNGHYELVGGAELSVDARIILQVEQHPGVSSRKLRELVGGRGGIVDKVASDLVVRGAILDMGKGDKHEYHPIARHTYPPMELAS